MWDEIQAFNLDVLLTVNLYWVIAKSQLVLIFR